VYVFVLFSYFLTLSATPFIYALSLHDALPISGIIDIILDPGFGFAKTLDQNYEVLSKLDLFTPFQLPILSALSRKSMIYNFLDRSEEHTSELQSRENLVCRLLLEKKNSINVPP